MDYKLTLSKEQLIVIKNALELRFRIDLLQDYDLSDILASKNIDLSQDNPNHDKIFDRYLERRDCIQEMIRAIFNIVKGNNFVNEREIEALRCQDIWGVIRHQLWIDSPDKTSWDVSSREVIKESDLELPKIERVDH